MTAGGSLSNTMGNQIVLIRLDRPPIPVNRSKIPCQLFFDTALDEFLEFLTSRFELTSYLLNLRY